MAERCASAGDLAVALALLALVGAAPMRRRRVRNAAQERIAEER